MRGVSMKYFSISRSERCQSGQVQRRIFELVNTSRTLLLCAVIISMQDADRCIIVSCIEEA
jgi:hypothetical protein